jgi:hypothetical protein
MFQFLFFVIEEKRDAKNIDRRDGARSSNNRR